MYNTPFSNIECPNSMRRHVSEIFNGEYDLAYSHACPTIIDIGANIGAFAIWASQRWQDATIHCYEPIPSNFAMLQRNLSRLDARRVHANHFAIGNINRTRMFLGRNNCGEASFFDMGEQTADTVDVETRDASVLPSAHILKLDTEGSEIEILEGHASIDYDVILIEFHGENNRRRVDAILDDYCLVGAKIRHPHRGVLKYIHRRIIPPELSRYEAH